MRDESIVVTTSLRTGGGEREHSKEDDDNVDPSVPVRYRGTLADRRDMRMLGKTQMLRKFQVSGNAWFRKYRHGKLGDPTSLSPSFRLFTFVLIDGGTALLFWGLVVCVFGLSCVYASLAELASISPTSGGQYHWVSEFAPVRIQNLLATLLVGKVGTSLITCSRLSGWLTTIGWQVYLAGICFMSGSVIQGLIALNVQDYVWHAYHGTLLTIAIILFSTAFNTVFAAKLPFVETLILFLHFCGLFAVIVPLWVMAPRAPVHETLLDFTNNGGWPSVGLSSMIGLTTPLSVLVGYDCSVHMSEEIQDASITLPRAMMSSIVLNSLLSFIMGVTLIFTLGDVDSLMNSVTRQPFIQQIFNATRSYGATNTIVSIVVILLTASVISEVATSSRQIWSFARDHGLPGSDWLSRVTPGWNISLQAVGVSLLVSSLLACINLGSSTALNAINSCGSVSILTSYIITIACILAKRLRGERLPPGRWSLRRFRLILNIIGLIFLIPVWFFSFWPFAMPVTASTMNWSSTMFGGLLILALVYYVVKARHRYTGPVVQVKRE